MYTLSRDELILILDALEWNVRATIIDNTDYPSRNDTASLVIKKIKLWMRDMDEEDLVSITSPPEISH